MLVILRTMDEIDTWLTAATPEALKLQRHLPDYALVVFVCGSQRGGEGAYRSSPAKVRLIVARA
jgi:putative SOS response-associated peptidase YedK